MIKLLQQFEDVLLRIGHPFIQCSEKPLRHGELLHLFDSNKLAINKELLNLYLWKGGLNGASIYNNQYFELCSYGSYIDCRSACSLYSLGKHSGRGQNGIMPIVLSNSGDFIAINLKKEDMAVGKMYVFSPSITLSEEMVSIYDSVYSFIATLIECYNTGAYKLSNNLLEVDYELEAEISRKYNPQSNFWKHD